MITEIFPIEWPYLENVKMRKKIVKNLLTVSSLVLLKRNRGEKFEVIFEFIRPYDHISILSFGRHISYLSLPSNKGSRLQLNFIYDY